jgi:hypothetical protein
VNINQLAHILRAAKAITGETVFVLVGSQAILAQYPEIPKGLALSMEIDIYPRFKPEMSEVIEGALGADSPFHGTFGYHADGVGPETACLPDRWEERSITLSGAPGLEGAEAICPEIHDLAAAKLVAFRDKDKNWVEEAIEAGLVQPETLRQRLEDIDKCPNRDHILGWIEQRERRDHDLSP